MLGCSGMRQQTYAPSGWNVILLAACLLLAACGGSSGGASPATTVPAANRPPVITSPAFVTVNEQTTGPVYPLTATDPDGDPVTLSVVMGGDDGVFSFAPATGILSLSAGLNFGAPQDADGNNICLVTFQARDGRGSVAGLTVEIRVLEVAVGMALRWVGTGFAQPLFLGGIPGTDGVVVLQKGGLARMLNPETGTIEGVPFLDLAGAVSTDSERGLLGLVFAGVCDGPGRVCELDEHVWGRTDLTLPGEYGQRAIG